MTNCLWDTENNPDHSEILLDFLSAFSHYFKDFAIVYDVTMATHNSKSSSSTMFAWARSYWRIFKEH